MRGKSGNVPFWPGGLDEVLLPQSVADSASTKIKGLRRIPPGFSRGLNLDGEPDEVDDLPIDAGESLVDAQTAEVRILVLHAKGLQ